MVKRRRLLRWLVLTALLGAVAFVGVSAFFAYRFTSPARRAFGARPEAFLSAYENVRFPARDGVTLDGWFVPCPATKRAVVLLHGYGGTRTQMLARARLFHDHGYAVLLYDARGHGRSDGQLVSFGYDEAGDLLGALDWLRARGFTELGCLGASQGGATIALAGAGLRGVRWAVLESVYPDLPNAIDRRFRRTFALPGWLLGSVMTPLAERRLGRKAATIRPRDAIRQLPCPVFILAGDRDVSTFPTDAREVFDAAPSPKTWWLLPGAGHVDLYGFAPQEYERRLLEFIAQALPAKPQ